MSVIACRCDENKIELAADSIFVIGESTKKPGISQKLVQVNEMIIGSVGLSEDGFLMQQFAESTKPQTADERGVGQFIVGFKEFRMNLHASNDSSTDFIIAYKGKAFLVNGLFIHEINDYHAIGAGADFALAALYLGHSAVDAVDAACHFSCFASSPIISYTMEREDKQ